MRPPSSKTAAEEKAIMQFSAFPSKSVSDAKPLPLSRQAFIKLFSQHMVRKEKDGKMFAPATFKGKRSNGTFLAACALCLDFDRGRPAVETVLESFTGCWLACYSTHSHTRGTPHFRVVIPLSRPVNAVEHASLVSVVKIVLAPELLECLDPTCFERARAHYLPSCPPEHEDHAFTRHQEGDPLDVDHFIRLGAAAMAEATKQLPAALNFEYADPRTGEVVNLSAWAAQNPGFDIVAAISRQFRRGSIRDGKQHITCPFDADHTDQGEDLATFVANASHGFPAWEVYCCHAHCLGRDRLEFLLAMLEKGWISVEQLRVGVVGAIQMRRPPRVYFPVKEILLAPEWSTLRPDERRIAYDLMVMMWAEDGTIADDDWKIARRLGVSDEEWAFFRETLKRAGWLIESQGRLTNTIAKDEFDKAQVAYMTWIQRAGAGGRATQEKARQNRVGAHA